MGGVTDSNNGRLPPLAALATTRRARWTGTPGGVTPVPAHARPVVILTGVNPPRPTVYDVRGIEHVATVTELRSRTSRLIALAKTLDTGVLIQRNNRPEAVLVSPSLYLLLVGPLGGAGPER